MFIKSNFSVEKEFILLAIHKRKADILDAPVTKRRAVEPNTDSKENSESESDSEANFELKEDSDSSETSTIGPPSETSTIGPSNIETSIDESESESEDEEESIPELKKDFS